MTDLPFDPALATEPPAEAPTPSASQLALPSGAGAVEPTPPPSRLPPYQPPQLTGFDKFAIATSALGQALSQAGGGQSTALQQTLAGINGRHALDIEARKAQNEELKYQQSVFQSFRTHQAALPDIFKKWQADVKTLAGQSLGGTPEEQQTAMASANALADTYGIPFAKTFTKSLFDNRGVLAGLGPLIDKVPLREGLFILQNAHQEIGKAGAEGLYHQVADLAARSNYQVMRDNLLRTADAFKADGKTMSYEAARLAATGNDPVLLHVFDGTYGTPYAKEVKGSFDTLLSQIGVKTPTVAEKGAEAGAAKAEQIRAQTAPEAIAGQAALKKAQEVATREAQGPELSTPVKDVLAGAGLNARLLDPAKKSDAAAISLARDKVVADELKKSAAQGVEGAKVALQKELEKPLAEKAALYFNKDGQSYADVGGADKGVAQAAKDGYHPVTSAQVSAATAAKATLVAIDLYRGLTDKLLVASSGNPTADALAIKTNQARLAFMRASGDPDAKALEGLEGLPIVASKALSNSARSNQQELNRLLVGFTTTGDTRESSHAKLDQMEALIRAASGVALPPSTYRRGGSPASNAGKTIEYVRDPATGKLVPK